jgi:hypothetical protein
MKKGSLALPFLLKTRFKLISTLGIKFARKRLHGP